MFRDQARPGVLALPATQQAADYAATQSYADTIRRPAAAVKNLNDGGCSLPVGSLVIVDDADHLDPGLLQSLVEHAATRTNTKLLLITNHRPDRGLDRTGRDGVAVLQENLPWAQHIGPQNRNAERNNAIDRVKHHLAAAGNGIDDPVHAEATELLARHAHLTREYRDEITARNRFITEMTRSRDRDRDLDRDDGLEL